MISRPGLGALIMRRVWVVVSFVVLACEEPPPQGAQQFTYQNGYAQTNAQANAQTTYQNGYAQRGVAPTSTSQAPVTYSPTSDQPSANGTAPTEIQTTPVPLGVEPLPIPSASASASVAAAAPSAKMAVPGGAAFACQSDAQCLLGRCNMQYKRCAYPCKSSELDCKAGNVCTASGLCMPRGAAGVKM
jgi:cytoskeletal protein RodZ